MPIATITSKGQVTIPKVIRDELGLRQGDRLLFVLEDDGSIRIRPKTIKLTDLIGILKTDKVATLEEIEQAISDGWTGR